MNISKEVVLFMNINKAISVLSDPTKDVLIIDNAKLVGWLK